MRWLIRVVVVVALLWGGWWWVAATAMKRGTLAWFEAQRAQGWVAQESGVVVNGFPSRLDLTVTAPILSDPATGIGWEAPFFQLLTLSYTPWHVIAALPPVQRITLPGAVVDVGSEQLRASVVLTPNTDLPLDRTAVAGDRLTLRTGAGAVWAAEKLRFGTRRAVDRVNGHDIGLDLRAITPDPAALALLPQDAGLPGVVDALTMTLALTFSAPIDRNAGATRPALTALDLRDLRLDWGDLQISAQGALAPDALGRAEGRIDLRVEGWPRALAAAVALGLVRAEVAPTWARVLEILAAPSGVPGQVDLPLVVTAGRASLGPLPLGTLDLFRAVPPQG